MEAWLHEDPLATLATLDFIGSFASSKTPGARFMVPQAYLYLILDGFIRYHTIEGSRSGMSSTEVQHPALRLIPLIPQWYEEGYQKFRRELGDAEDNWREETQNHPANHSEKSRTKANTRTSMKTVTHESYPYGGNQSTSLAVNRVRWWDPLVEIRIFK
jgi:hypothetical protein